MLPEGRVSFTEGIPPGQICPYPLKVPPPMIVISIMLLMIIIYSVHVINIVRLLCILCLLCILYKALPLSWLGSGPAWSSMLYRLYKKRDQR